MQIYRSAAAACAALVLLMVSAPAQAQYRLTNLVSNQVDEDAPNTDPLLANAWGLARSATSPWWISDNDTGWSTLYYATGTIESLKVVIPTAGNGPASPTGGNGPGTPTGIVYNGSKTDFLVQGNPASFIFATLDGTISAWSGAVNKNLATLIAGQLGQQSHVTRASPSPAIRPATSSTRRTTPTTLSICIDGTFTLVKSFGDPSVPSTLSVFGIQDINGMVYVAYAVPNAGAGGFIDVFQEDGTFVKTLIKGDRLNQGWGIALAPAILGR